MPLSLVFTSAPRGLAPGRSGYVTVARHEEMPARLAELLESIGTPHESPGSATYTLRLLEAGGRRWRVLSRFTAGGLDHTRRDNRLAHHLAFAEEELLALPPPADVARRWTGWLDGWEGEPAWLPPLRLDLRPGNPLVPCASWREITGSGGKAAWLVGPGGAATRSLSGDVDAGSWLRLLAEAGALLGPAAWDAPFTTDAAVTGAGGFAWRCQSRGGDIDLAAAAGMPAPEGPEARRASLGVGSMPPRRSDPVRSAAPEAGNGAESGSRLPLILGAAAGLGLAVLATWLALRPKPEPAPPAPPPAPRAPTPADMEAARNLLRDQAALGEINDYLARDDVAQAARLWLELARVAPAFAQRNAEPTLARIRSRLAAASARSVTAALERPGAAADPARVGAALEQAAESIRIGEAVGAPRDASWTELAAARDRAKLLSALDIRPTLVVGGRWVTASAGPAVPASADFDLGSEAGAEIRRFLSEGLTGGPGSTGRGAIKLVAFRHIAHRDPAQPRAALAVIEPGVSSIYIGESRPGGGRPGISLTVGSRTNAVSLNLSGPPAPGLLATCQAVELTNAAGRRLCVALVPDETRLEALTLPLGAIAEDPATKSLALAGWIESAFADVRLAGARPGLYPAGHAFPDRAIPSLVSPPSQLDTTLLRLASGQGPSMPRAELAERQRLAREGDARRAGAPWTIRAVNLAGQAVTTLAEIRE